MKLAKLLDLRELFTHRTINFNLMIALLFIAIIPATTINLFYYNKMNHSMEEKAEVYSREIIKLLGEKLGFVLNQSELIKKQVIAVSFGLDISEIYGEPSPSDKVIMPYKTDRLLRNIIRDFPPIAEVYLVESNGANYSSNSNRHMEKLMQMSWMRDIEALPYEDIVVPTHPTEYAHLFGENNINVVSFVKKINMKRGYSDTTGAVQVDLKYEAIKDIIAGADIGQESFIIIKDRDNKIIYFPDEKYLGKDIGEVHYKEHDLAGILNEDISKNKAGLQKFIKVNYTLSSVNWDIIGMISKGDIGTEAREAKDISQIIIIISTLFSFFLAYTLSKGIVRPIKKIIKIMEKVEKGNFDIMVPDIKNKDLHVLSNSFNMMVNRINILMKNIIEKETEKTNAQLKALQAQINPHFLYNTLEVVRSIAIEYEADSIEEIAQSLAKMFRYNINKKNDIVTLGEEIEHIRNYIRIQKYRYGDKFDVFYDIPEELRQYKIVRLTIQPLVENAIYHGIEMMMGMGTIVIRAAKGPDGIHIYVMDNGLGMSCEKVAYINRAFQGSKLESEVNGHTDDMGIGIINVNTRLKLTYGSEFELSVRSRPNIETVVEIHIPAVIEEG